MEAIKTSTPVGSPLRKKHLVQKFVAIDETLGDIESEIQSRRQEAINKSTEGRRRLSTVPLLAGYSVSQLTQHCKDVIKLSTENKINCKNAFNFWLIDAMAAMAKKNDSEINKNFQVASCTLDASVKIYGYRVDAIHTDAVKMAGGFFTKVPGNAGENEGEEEGDVDGETKQKGEPAAVKAKRKKKKLTTLPPESLNAKTESEVLLDAVPRPNFLSRKTNGNDLLVKIPKFNDGGLLLLDSDRTCWPFTDGEKTVKCDASEIFDSELLVSLISGIDIGEDDDLCPAYKNVQFGKEAGDDDSDEELQMSQNSGRFEFDANASLNEISLDEGPEEQRNRIEIPAGGFESDEEILIRAEKKKTEVGPAISDMKYRITVDSLEYSMFDEKTLKAWAGPSHWKVRPMRKPLEDFANQENLSKPAASKRTRKGKIKCRPALFDATEDVLVKNLMECEKTTLIKSTMLNWNPLNTTIPKDLKCQSKNLFFLYHLPSFSIAFRGEDEEVEEVSDHPVSEPEDMDYCSSSVVRDEDGDVEGEALCLSPQPDVEPCDEAWDSANMVEAPNKVEKIQVSAFKRRKHVDIKHLKRGLWDVLTNGGDADEENRTKEVPSVEFAHLVKTYSNKVPKKLETLISAPLIFNALLHLTNEKSLVLTQNKSNKFNFFISR